MQAEKGPIVPRVHFSDALRSFLDLEPSCHCVFARCHGGFSFTLARCGHLALLPVQWKAFSFKLGGIVAVNTDRRVVFQRTLVDSGMLRDGPGLHGRCLRVFW